MVAWRTTPGREPRMLRTSSCVPPNFLTTDGAWYVTAVTSGGCSATISSSRGIFPGHGAAVRAFR